jgi:hypothetical protein
MKVWKKQPQQPRAKFAAAIYFAAARAVQLNFRLNSARVYLHEYKKDRSTRIYLEMNPDSRYA